MGRPQDILNWAAHTFGRVALQRQERTARFVEEAIELAQADDMTALQVMKILARVYERPKGQYRKEIAQCGMTLEALAANVACNLDEAIQGEFDRVRAIPMEHWQDRHDAKVKLGIAEAR